MTTDSTKKPRTKVPRAEIARKISAFSARGDVRAVIERANKKAAARARELDKQRRVDPKILKKPCTV